MDDHDRDLPVVLLTFANDRVGDGSGYLRDLVNERKGILHAFKGCRDVEVVDEANVTPDDFFDLLDHHLVAFHYGGHAEGDGLTIEDPRPGRLPPQRPRTSSACGPRPTRPSSRPSAAKAETDPAGTAESQLHPLLQPVEEEEPGPPVLIRSFGIDRKAPDQPGQPEMEQTGQPELDQTGRLTFRLRPRSDIELSRVDLIAHLGTAGVHTWNRVAEMSPQGVGFVASIEWADINKAIPLVFGKEGIDVTFSYAARDRRGTPLGERSTYVEQARLLCRKGRWPVSSCRPECNPDPNCKL